MAFSRGVLAAALVVACGGTQHGPALKAPAPKVVTYSPLGIKADAKAPSQAVILGTDEASGSTVIPLPAAPSTVQIDGTTLVTAPNPEPSVQVTGGTSPQGRAMVWSSAIVAASVLDKDVADYTFSATGGDLDGALLTGGFLAAMTGAPVDRTATVTGTIHPDGTVGPVEGLAETFRAAIDNGKKRLGYPSGMRMAKSASGELVDLVALAKAHGAEAVEIPDVYAAYKLLTGKDLPAPVPVPAAEMALDKATSDALEARYKDWQQRVAADWSTLVQLDTAGRLPATLRALRDYAKRNAEAAEALHKRGLAPAAYSRMIAASVFASTTTRAYDLLSKVQSGNVKAAIDALKALDHETTPDVLAKIRAVQPATLGGQLQVLAAYQASLRGAVYQTMASTLIGLTTEYLEKASALSKAELGAPDTADKVMSALAQTLLYVARGTAETTLATDELELGDAPAVAYTSSPLVLQRATSAFSSAAAAGITYADALLGIKDEDMRKRVGLSEPDYLVAYVTLRVATRHEPASSEPSLEQGLVQLAGSELAYDDTAALIAKYGSLGVHIGDDGKVDAIAHDKAFVHLLAAAERNARASAHAAKIATGAIPVQAKLAYQLAIALRDGDLDDKLDALAELWTSSAFSQTAVMLARNGAPELR
jgi:hypothetical protein